MTLQQSSPTNNSSDANAVLESAAARNLPVELHIRDQGSNRLTVARTRILGIGDDELLLDRPQAIGAELCLALDQPVDLYFRMDDNLYRFETHVRRLPIPVELRESKSVLGMAVARPLVALSGQRRNYFRVLVASIEPITATLHDASRDAIDSAPLNARRFAGEVVDLSLGGAAVRVDNTSATTFSLNDPLYIAFQLPEQDRHDILIGRVRQTRAIQDTGNTRIGLEFLPWPDERQFERIQDRLQRFITRLQRERLRKAG